LAQRESALKKKEEELRMRVDEETKRQVNIKALKTYLLRHLEA